MQHSQIRHEDIGRHKIITAIIFTYSHSTPLLDFIHNLLPSHKRSIGYSIRAFYIIL